MLAWVHPIVVDVLVELGMTYFMFWKGFNDLILHYSPYRRVFSVFLDSEVSCV